MDLQKCVAVFFRFDLGLYNRHGRMEEHFGGEVLFGLHELPTEIDHVGKASAGDVLDVGCDLGSLESGLPTASDSRLDGKKLLCVVAQSVLRFVLVCHGSWGFTNPLFVPLGVKTTLEGETLVERLQGCDLEFSLGFREKFAQFDPV